MALTSATGTNTATAPTHAVGDWFVLWAYRDGNTTAPTVPSAGWTTCATGGSNTNSGVLVMKKCTSSSETVGTFTDATSVILVVIPSADIAGGYVVPIGYTTGGASTTLGFPAITDFWDSHVGNSMVLAFAGHRATNTTTDQAPTGFTNITSVSDATDEAAAHYSTSRLSSYAGQTQSVGGTSSGWRTAVVEVVMGDATPSVATDLPLGGFWIDVASSTCNDAYDGSGSAPGDGGDAAYATYGGGVGSGVLSNFNTYPAPIYDTGNGGDPFLRFGAVDSSTWEVLIETYGATINNYMPRDACYELFYVGSASAARTKVGTYDGDEHVGVQDVYQNIGMRAWDDSGSKAVAYHWAGGAEVFAATAYTAGSVALWSQRYYNGKLGISLDAGAFAETASAAWTRPTDNGLGIGGYPSSGGRLVGDMYACGFFTRPLTDTERSWLAAWAAAKVPAAGISGVLSATLAALTLSSAGVSDISGSLDKALASATLSAAGVSTVLGTASVTLGVLSASVAGESVIAGTADLALEGMTVAATAIAVVRADLSTALGALTVLAAAQSAVVGVASIPLADVEILSTAIAPVEGTLAATLDPMVIVSAGILPIDAQVSGNLDALTIVATAGTATSVSGAMDATLGDLTLVGTGSSAIGGVASVHLGDATLSASAESVVAAAAPITLGALALAASASSVVSGGASASLGALTIAATGASTISALAAVTLSGATLTASGQSVIAGAAFATLGSLTLSARGYRASPGPHCCTITVRSRGVTLTLSQRQAEIAIGQRLATMTIAQRGASIAVAQPGVSITLHEC